MKKPIVILSILFIFVVTACRNQRAVPTPTPSPPPTITPSPTATQTPASTPPSSPTPKPPPQGHLTLGVVGTVNKLNPLLDLNPALAKISPLLFPTLNRIDPDTAQPQPGVATLPTISADDLTLTYTLRLTAITPADVQASIQAAIWPELADIRTVETVGADRVRVTLTQPNCGLGDMLAQLPILSAADATADVPVGRAPFTVQQWDADSQTLTLAAAAEASPRLASITVQFYADAELAQGALDTGKVDMVQLADPPAELPARFKVVPIPVPQLVFVTFNTQQPPFDQPTVRQAFSFALDRWNIQAKTFAGQGTLAASIQPPQFWTPFSGPGLLDYAPESARVRLDDAGIRDTDGDGWRELPGESQPWRVSVGVDVAQEALRDVAFWVAEYYRQVGVQARVDMVPFSAVIDNLLTHDYQVIVYQWPLLPTLDESVRWHSNQIDAEFGENITGYSNTTIDTWLDNLNRAPACAADVRAGWGRKIALKLDSERPIDPILYPSAFLVVDKSLAGIAAGRFAPFTWNAANWYRTE